MNAICPVTSPFATPCICPLRIMLITRIALERPPRGFKRKEAQPRFDQPLDEAVVLFNQIIEILDLSEFTLVGDESCLFQFRECFGIGSVFVHVDHARFAAMRSSERLEKEAFGGFAISGRAEEKLQGVSLRIDGPIQIQPLLFDFNVRLINTPGVRCCLQMGSASLVQFGSIALHGSRKMVV
jgi:hypothetical protein